MSVFSGRGAFIPATSLIGFENLKSAHYKLGMLAIQKTNLDV